MKSILLLLAFATLAHAQQPAPKPSARMTARAGAAGMQRDNSFVTDYGSHEYDISRSVRVDAELTTTNREEFPAVLRWYVIGKTLIRNSPRSLLKSGELPVKIAPRVTTKVSVDSGQIKASDDTYMALGQRYVSGNKIDGWVLRLVAADGTELSTASNTSEALAWMKLQPKWKDPAATKAGATPAAARVVQ
jgi:hypothetical protein